MSHITTGLLAKIAAIGGFAVAVGGYYFQNCIQNNLKQSEYYTESLRILRSHEGIAHYMGTPIYEGRLNLGDTENNYCTGKEAKFQVPVRGSKKKGTFYLFATREEFTDSWKIQRLELGFEDTPGKRIMVFDGSRLEE